VNDRRRIQQEGGFSPSLNLCAATLSGVPVPAGEPVESRERAFPSGGGAHIYETGFTFVHQVSTPAAQFQPSKELPRQVYRLESVTDGVLRLVELVEAHSGIGRIELQVERRRLDGFLLVAGQVSEAVGEGVGNAKFH
jgi:hypothetical protein